MTFRSSPKFVSIEAEKNSLPECMNNTKNSYDTNSHEMAGLLGLPGLNTPLIFDTTQIMRGDTF